MILLVDERPEEVSEAISWGVGEVIASSFDQPADRHVEVTEMVLEHARRLVRAIRIELVGHRRIVERDDRGCEEAPVHGTRITNLGADLTAIRGCG